MSNKFDIELVGKIGSMALINDKYKDMDYNIIARLSRELRPGYIWVTSGAAEIGRLDYMKRNNGRELDEEDENSKVDYSAQGQAILMSNYRQFTDSRYSLRQILVEHTHFNDGMKREHLKELLLRCPRQNAIPIINYNDPVSYDEIVKFEIQQYSKMGVKAVQCVDNDETASQIACLVKTKRLLIMTGVDGIYSDFSDKNSLVRNISGKDVYELIENVEHFQTSCQGSSRKGANGAWAKLEYIKAPLKNGAEVFIANSAYSIEDILSGKAPSTRIGVK
ncbi:MAG: uridylate kinase [Clostridia bacterium]|jgi:glutamate 5-kinase|nr:uridylate kinase [Clostridia bacterium]MCX4367463.1 uridylate kinase [Clostridia bacterium]